MSPFLEDAVKLPQSGSRSTAVSAKECGVFFTTSSDKRVDALLWSVGGGERERAANAQCARDKRVNGPEFIGAEALLSRT